MNGQRPVGVTVGCACVSWYIRYGSGSCWKLFSLLVFMYHGSASLLWLLLWMARHWPELSDAEVARRGHNWGRAATAERPIGDGAVQHWRKSVVLYSDFFLLLLLFYIQGLEHYIKVESRFLYRIVPPSARFDKPLDNSAELPTSLSSTFLLARSYQTLRVIFQQLM